MITLKNIELTFHGESLYHEVNLEIFRKQRIGLIGANGTGKSSLLAIINGNVTPDKGDVSTANQLRIANMYQSMPDADCSALDFVLQGHQEYVQLQQQLTEAYDQQADQMIIECLARLDDMNAYHLEAEAAVILHGLGFSKHDIHKAVNTFSGGWRMRLQLAQALLKPSDVMLLDEPTNHLDIAAIAWLEQFLQKYDGAVVVISHDRIFLDNVVSCVWHIEQHEIRAYKGNYSDFERLRAELIKAQQAISERQQRSITHMQQFIDRFRAKATKAKQVQSRIKALEKIETIQVVQDKIQFEFEFKAAHEISNPALLVEQFSVGYQQPILSIEEMRVNSGDRIGLLGVNGAGKSTLLKTLAKLKQPLSGTMAQSPKLSLGYYAQDQVEQLRYDQTPVWHIQKQHPQWSEQQVRNFLGGFNFRGDKALTSVEHFSGGEQSRLMLAVLASKQCNFLLLDEPTNHLDMEMRNALVISLQEFSGSFMVISHDRYLLESCCDQFLLVDNGCVTPFDGDMNDYQQWLKDRETEKKQENSKTNKKTKSLPSKAIIELEKELKALEQRINKLNHEIAALDQELAQPELYQQQHQAHCKQLQESKLGLLQQLDELQEQWYYIMQQLEQQ